MEILNASMSEIADTFLHPGYMSAYVEVTQPGSLTAEIIPVDKEPIVQMDMGVALRLTPAMRDAMGSATAPRPPGPTVPPLPWVTLLVVALALSRGNRFRRERHRSRRRPQLLAVAAAIALVAVVACDADLEPDSAAAPSAASRSTPVPTGSASERNTDPRIPFENPRAATEAILNGVIADAIACSPAEEITSLAGVRSQVGLPVAYKTPGMRWAIANYGDDGWGRPFRFRELAKGRFEVTSAAEDGEFGTADDISLEMGRADAFTWPKQLRAYYLRRERDDVGVSFHRCGATKTRRKLVQWTARGLNGDALFGVITEWDFSETQRKALRGRIEQVTGNRERDALVLAVYDPKHIGRLTRRTVLVPNY